MASFKRSVCLLSCLWVLHLGVAAQEKILSFLDVHPKCVELNPATSFNRSLVIFEPGISFSSSNSSLTFNTMFNRGKGSQDSLLFWDFDQMEKKLKEVNYFQSDAKINLIFAGLKLANNYYLSFSLSKHGLAYMSYPGSFTQLRYGNADFENNRPRTIMLNGYSFDGMIYNEFSFGLARDVDDKFSWGLRIKYLQGKVSVKTSKFMARIETDNNFTQSVMKTDIKFMVSSPVLAKENTNDDIKVETRKLVNDFSWPNFTLNNPGLAFDAGFHYYCNYRLKISGSITDVGFIRWGENPQQIYSKGEYTYDGLYFSAKDISNFDAKNYFKAYTDTLQSIFSPYTNSKPYITGLRAKAFVTAELYYNNRLSFHALLKSIFYKNITTPEVSAGFVYKPFRRLDISAAWSFSDYSFYNIGLGFSYTFKRVQVYAVTDNVNAIDILNSRGVSFAFGANWLIFQDMSAKPFSLKKMRRLE